MPTTITAQDGATIQQNTKITPEGCAGVLASKTSKPTRAQQLAKTLARCRHKNKHNTHKRQACEQAARRRYSPRKTVRGAEKATASGHG